MLPAREQFGRRCDAVVHAGVLVLLTFAPLAFGAVHPWSLATVQLLVAALTVVWACKLLVCGSTSEANERLRRWRWPLVAFAALAVLQLIPLPPSALKVLSRNTEAIYAGNLWGWPNREPFGEITQTAAGLGEPVTPNAIDNPLTRRLWQVTAQLPQTSTWRPLSVYTYRSIEELLLMLTWAAVFFCSSATRGTARST